jgi:type IV pilus assembly protein PilM
MSIIDSLFGGGSKDLLGLDISSSAVKLLELSRKGDRYQVESYAVEPLPPNAVTDKQLSDPQVVGECIARAVKRAAPKTKNVALAVAGASVITKVIQMPATLSEADLEEQIRVEADQYIPYPIEEVNLDFQVQGPSGRGTGMVDVLLAACRKEQVEQRCAAAEIAGLLPRVVDIEAHALENACLLLRDQMIDQGRNKTVAIVDMGANTTSLLVLHDMQPVYTRDQTFGGRQLTEDVMRHYGMTFEEAGRAKRLGDLPDDYGTVVLPSFIADMAQQIDRSLQFFFASSSQYTTIDQVMLAGGCAHLPGVDQLLQDRLQIPTSVARPFARMSVAARAKPALLAKDECTLLLACGLALRAFDEV